MIPVEEITYLVASFDRGEYVADCLASLRGQTDPGWRAVIVDDASTDDSLERIAPYLDTRIRLLRHDRNLGYVAALQRLIDEAETDIVAILDPDDALEPEATALLRRAYATDPGAAFVYSRFTEYDQSFARPLGTYGGPVPPGGTAIRDGPVGAIRSFRRSAYRRTAGLDASMRYAEDRDLVYKLEEVTRPRFVDVPLYRYRRLPDSHTGNPRSREEGARNVRRARRAALRRRDIGGVPRAAAEIMILADYVAYSERSGGLARRLAAAAAVVAAGVWRSAEHARGYRRPAEPERSGS